MFRTILRAVLLGLALCPALRAQDPRTLRCVSYERNSLSGPRIYTDCSDGTFAPPWNDGISWFYNRSRMDNFFRQKNEEKIYSREFLVRTGMTPAEADRIIAHRGREGAPPDEAGPANPEKANLNIMELAASEMFVYASTDQQKNLADAYFEAAVSPPHISARTTPEQKAELKSRLDRLAADLSALKQLAGEFLVMEKAPWGAPAAELKRMFPVISEKGANLYGVEKEIAGARAELSFRLMGDRLVSVTLAFRPLNILRMELEQLRLLLGRDYGWPSECKYRDAGELDCSWDVPSGVRINTSARLDPDGGKTIEISLISQKIMDELLGKVKGGDQ